MGDGSGASGLPDLGSQASLEAVQCFPFTVSYRKMLPQLERPKLSEEIVNVKTMDSKNYGFRASENFLNQ